MSSLAHQSSLKAGSKSEPGDPGLLRCKHKLIGIIVGATGAVRYGGERNSLAIGAPGQGTRASARTVDDNNGLGDRLPVPCYSRTESIVDVASQTSMACFARHAPRERNV